MYRLGDPERGSNIHAKRRRSSALGPSVWAGSESGGERRSGHALAFERLDLELVVVAQVDEIDGGCTLWGQRLEIGQQRFDPREVDAPEKCARRLVCALLGSVERDEAVHDVRDASRGHLRSDPAETRLGPVDTAPEHHEVLRHDAISELADAALEPEPGDVMLAAAVGTAADFDVEAGHL